ncbi:MAG: OmpH family outer membrane protein [Desulfobacterales bacterium]|jgi:outer membrane protein|nr:OmpH family outer membrane protein [Desulfobacterales bacterium]
MQMRKIGFLTALVSCFLFVALARGADVAKIGMVDFQKILTLSEAGKEAQAEIATKGKAMEADLKTKGAELEETKERLEREALVMAPEKRSEKEREFRIKLMDFKDKEKQYKKEFNDFNMQLVGKFRKDVFALAEEIGKKEGYLLILEKNESGALYFPGTMDITDQLIQKYNQTYTKKAK